MQVNEPADRKRFRAVCPDCTLCDVLNDDELDNVEFVTFKPVIAARLVPRFNLDMHNLSGMSGYGRFAVEVSDKIKWLDEFETIHVECRDGIMFYALRDELIAGGEICVTLSGTIGCAATVIKIEPKNILTPFNVYFVYGGLLGWIDHSLSILEYQPDMCYANHICFDGSCVKISVEDAEADICFDDLTPLVPKRPLDKRSAVHLIGGWKPHVFVRGSGQCFSATAPTALDIFKPDDLHAVSCAQNATACMCLGDASIMYVAVGMGHKLLDTPLAELFDMSIANCERISNALNVQAGNPLLEGLVSLCALSNNAMFEGNVFVHGLSSWRDGFLGWRLAYGSLVYGFFGHARKHFLTHLSKGFITEGPDRGAICHSIESARPDGQIFYAMYETFLDQAKKYVEYTGDMSIKPQLITALEGCIERAIRRLKPGKEWLFENSLNTWISDTHWSIMGQCTQASAYMYNMALFAAELTEGERRQKYAEMAASIKADMHQHLWMKRKGMFAYCQDLRGNRLLHTEPELPDVYHPAEMGLVDDFHIYQMLDWVEGNLPHEDTPGGGRIYWSSNWHPNTADSYTHSTYELALAEQLNLAMIYQQIGLAEEGYQIFKATYNAVFGGDVSDVFDHNLDQYIEKSMLPTVLETAGGIPGQIHTNGTSRRSVDFSDTISMLGRAIGEGLLGIQPKRNHRKITLAPCLPTEIPHIKVNGPLFAYEYTCKPGSISIVYENKCADCTVDLLLHLPVAEINSVHFDRQKRGFTVVPEFCGIGLHIKELTALSGQVDVAFTPIDITPLGHRVALDGGTQAAFFYPDETILSLDDPQGLLESANLRENKLTATVTTAPGTGVFFLQMCAGGVEYIRPVKVDVLPREETKVYVPIEKAYAAPYEWVYIDLDTMFNASSPLASMEALANALIPVPEGYNTVNLNYLRMHLTSMNRAIPRYTCTDVRWRSKVNSEGIALTDEGIPFRSKHEGNYIAMTTLMSRIYPDFLDIDVDEAGRALYLMVTGVTYPMQSHVENLRITLEYEDGTTEEHRLVNPFHIGDMWYTNCGRYHDTPLNGFENLSGNNGCMSSIGQDLTKPIETDTEAHIIMYPMKPRLRLHKIRFQTIACDTAFGLIGITVLK